MVESVGKKLREARLQRGFSIEETAHATKLRPDKILALESDDYARFASNAYAKGFLQIYGRFLGVNVSDFAKTLDSSSHISVSDYQYLSNGIVEVEPQRSSSTFSFHQKRQIPSVVPLIAFVALLALGVFGYRFYLDWQRVTGEAAFGGAGQTPGITSGVPTPAPTTLPASISPEQPGKPEPGSEVLDRQPAVRAEAVQPVASAATATTSPPTNPVANEVLVEPLKTTWITVRRDDPKSAPVYEDYLYRDARPLKLKGPRFFIEAKDPSAIQIRKNGAPIAYQAPGVEVR